MLPVSTCTSRPPFKETSQRATASEVAEVWSGHRRQLVSLTALMRTLTAALLGRTLSQTLYIHELLYAPVFDRRKDRFTGLVTSPILRR